MTEADRDRERPDLMVGPGSGSDRQTAGSPAPEITEDEAPSVELHSYLGAQLRAVYDDVASQPVPDRFLELMKRLG